MEKKTFTDPTIPAAFVALKKSFQITPHRNLSGKVEFRIEGDGIDEALEEVYRNSSVGCLDFISALKNFRSSIFVLKAAGAQRG